MKIAIVTMGRFHVLDLARELNDLGQDVVFYSCVPLKRFARFGFPINKQINLLYLFAPLLFLKKILKGNSSMLLDRLLLYLFDNVISLIIKPCDVFIGMSGLAIKSAETAKKKYGAKILIERGSRHILSQKEILESIKSQKKVVVPAYSIKKEIKSYEIADFVVIPSQHVQESFIEFGYPKEKLFRNAYGVDLEMFIPSKVLQNDIPIILFVGSWSYQKGVDILYEAWKKIENVRLLHIGSLGDVILPKDINFEHHEPVPQWELVNYYSQANLFVMPSRQEGLSLVLVQALACGLPIVCTTRTGGQDLKEIITDKSLIEVVPPDDVEILKMAIEKMLIRSQKLKSRRDILGVDREKLSWEAYGKRYNEFLNRITK